MQMTWLAIPWFVLTTTGSPARMGIVAAAEIAPAAVLGIVSGSFVARFGARMTMLFSDAVRTVLVALIPTLHVLDALSFGVLIVIVLVLGVFLTPYAGAQRVIIPELVGEDPKRVGEAMSLFNGAMSAAGLLGPPIAGILIGTVGATAVLYVDAATYLVAFVLIGGFVPRLAPVPEAPEDRGLLTGVRFILRDRLLRAWTLGISGINFAWSAMAIALPVLVLERYGERPEILGWTFGAFGLGAVTGAALSYRLMSRVEHKLLGGIAGLAQVAFLWIFVVETPVAVLVGASLLAGIAMPILNSAVMTERTTRTPPALRPKVNTVAVTGAVLLSPLGALLAGPALEAFPLETVLVATMLAMTASMLLIAVWGFRYRNVHAPYAGDAAPGFAVQEPDG
jgi:MFS family permease